MKEPRTVGFLKILFRLARWHWLACLTIACIPAKASDGDSAFFAWRRVGGGYFLGHDFFDRSDAAITEETVSGFKIGLPLYFTSRLSLDFGLGFVFWYPVWRSEFESRLIRFDPGVDRAYLRYEDEAEGWKYSFTAGLFDFAADEDAAVLGDYLLRYGSYPGSGVERPQSGWAASGDTKVPLQGMNLDLSAPSGKFRQRFLGLMDSTASGKGTDFSLAYILGYSATRNVDLGFGVEWLRFASTRPGETAPKSRSNAYVKTDTGYVVLDWDTTGSVAGDTGFYTRAATQIMVKAALNLQGIFDLKSWGEKDWRVYGEAALLGLANQPVFYDERFRRIAFMAGVNLPSFGWLDRFAIEAEWHQRHTPYAEFPSGYFLRSNSDTPLKDPSSHWKESVFISKSIFPWLGIQGEYSHYPVPLVYADSITADLKTTYTAKTLLFDRFIVRVWGGF